jgi:hypothetical protein
MFLGAKMADNFFWKCTFCSLNGMFGVLNSIGQHVKGVAHVLAKKTAKQVELLAIKCQFKTVLQKGFL